MTALPCTRTRVRESSTRIPSGGLLLAALLALVLAACDSGDPSPAGSEQTTSTQPMAPPKPEEPTVRPPAGDISAVIDGLPRTWRLQAGQGTGQSGWRPLNPSDSRVTMVAQAIGEHASDTEPLILEFTVRGTATRAAPADAVLRYGKLPGTEARMRLESVDIRDQSLVLVGSFMARLPVETGAAEQRLEDGSFSATVYRLPRR